MATVILPATWQLAAIAFGRSRLATLDLLVYCVVQTGGAPAPPPRVDAPVEAQSLEAQSLEARFPIG